MSKHHRDRSWAPAPQPLPENAHVIDNHTHVASVVPFSQAMSHEAQEKGQPEVPVYSVDELLNQAQQVGVEGVIDCGCELPNLMTAIDTAIVECPDQTDFRSNTNPGTTPASKTPWPRCTVSLSPTPIRLWP